MITWLLRGNRLWDSCAFTVSRILLRVWLPQIYRSLSSLSRYLQIEVHALWKERFHWAPSNKGRIYIKRRGAPFPNRPLSSKRPIFKWLPSCWCCSLATAMVIQSWIFALLRSTISALSMDALSSLASARARVNKIYFLKFRLLIKKVFSLFIVLQLLLYAGDTTDLTL